MLTKPTTTGSAGDALSELQRRALAEAEAQRWCIYVEGAGERVPLRRGYPARSLVLQLAGELPPVTSSMEAA